MGVFVDVWLNGDECDGGERCCVLECEDWGECCVLEECRFWRARGGGGGGDGCATVRICVIKNNVIIDEFV